MSELKRCPFCGGEFEVVGKGHYFAHKTNGCILQHLCFETDDEEAIEAWNTRKPIEKVLERLEERKKNSLKSCETMSNSVVFSEAIEIIKEEVGM